MWASTALSRSWYKHSTTMHTGTHLPDSPHHPQDSPDQLDAMTKAELVNLVQQLGDNVQLLIQHSRSAEDIAAPAIARLALMTLELRQQQTALLMKEKRKKTT